MKRLYYLIELDIAGSIHRMSSQTLSVYSTKEGRDLIFLNELTTEFEWVDEIDFFKIGSVNETSAVLEFFSKISVAELISQGHQLEYSPARIYLWLEGDTYEQAQLIVNGYTVEWEWSADNEPVICTLVGKPVSGGQQMPRQYQIISEDTHGSDLIAAYQTSTGETKWYPLCFWGQQTGIFGPEGNRLLPMVEAPLLNNHTSTSVFWPTMVLGGELDPLNWYMYVDNAWYLITVDNSLIQINENMKGEIYTFFTEEALAPDGSSILLDDVSSVWLTCVNGALKFGTEIIDNASLLTRYLVQESGATVDLVRSKAALEVLETYPIQIIIEEPVDVIEWLSDIVWQYAPIAAKYGPDGLYLVRFDKNAVPTSKIIVNSGIERLSSVKMEGLDNIANSFYIKGLYAIRKDTYLRSLYRNSETNYACSLSEKSFGKRHLELTCPAFKDLDTLNQVLDWMTDFYSQPYKRVAYSLPTHYNHLRAGDVISITDDEIYISEKTCYIEEVAFRETSVDITVIYY